MGLRSRPISADWLPRGFVVAGIHCGVKISAASADLAIFASETPCTAVGTFTSNRVVAAPVQVTRQRVPSGEIRGVVVNSGNANACTGDQGLRDAQSMATTTATHLGCRPEQVLVCSTGIIGTPLPMEAIRKGIAQACAQLSNATTAWEAASRAITTTDTITKVAFSNQHAKVLGIAKGAGMIAPRMATMLAFLFTDAAVDDAQALQQMLREVVDRSFNCISVDGHTSTNDTVLLLANGASGTRVSTDLLREDVAAVCHELARQIVEDGEGATKLIVIDVVGARSEEEAREVARAVADSPLVKTAFYGADPNWGRIVSAVGYAAAEVDPSRLSVRLMNVPLFCQGAPVEFDRGALSEQMRQARELHLTIDLALGSSTLRFWTCDLTEAYVRFNAEYS